MKDNNGVIKINLGQIVLVFVALAVLVFGGSLWDKQRTKQKLKKMTQASERILSVRSDEILRVFEKDNVASESALLNSINLPEKGIYQIGFLVKSGDFYRYVGRYGEKRELNSVEKESLKSLLKSDKSVASDVDVFAKQKWVEDRIYVFSPVQNTSGDLVVYMVLGVNRKQNL